jgi:predicted dehydrogenase
LSIDSRLENAERFPGIFQAMPTSLTRRKFLRQSSLSAAGLLLARRSAWAQKTSPNDRLNIGMIGVANQANYDLTNVATENIVALCDVDQNFLAAAAQKFPGAKTYDDFRRLLEQRDIDAVVVATPDHTHAVATVAALNSGRHVYCEKPLTRTISECRVVMEAARKARRATQIGTQIHAGKNYRRVVELVQSGAIGSVNEVHVWVSATYGGKDLPSDAPPVPSNLHYDLWLGPVPYRPYSPEYVPFKWRNWWAFGGGALADFGCHYLDLPHWALGLRVPRSAEVVEGPPVHPESTPPWLVVRYEYPERAQPAQPPVKLTWYHGGKQPPTSLLSAELADKWKSGVLFIGKQGLLLADYNRHKLLPENKFAGFVAPAPFIADSIGHHAEWIKACKTGGATTCQFDYSGPLSETALLGNVAFRTGKKIDWDSANLRAKGCPEADEFIQHHYREGWKI